MATELNAELRELIEKPALGHAITFNRDGSPQVTVVWIDVNNGKPSFNTNNIRAKFRNLSRDPRVVLSILDPDDTQRYAVVHGTATISEEGAFDQIDKLARKYTEHEKYPWLQPGEQRVTVDIDVEKVRGSGPWAS